MKSTAAILILLMLTAQTGIALAGEAGRCRTIQYKEGRVYTIKSAMYKGTSIKLPERLMMDPILSNDLWDAEGRGHYVMVKPNSSEPQGEEVSMTLVTVSNKTFNFVLQRAAQGDTCATVEEGPVFFKDAKAADYKTPEEIEQMELQRQVGELQKALQEEKAISDERLANIIAKYRATIYTRYKWSEGMGFMGADLISDVWDDGRFTYIRVKESNRGMLAVKGEIDGQQEMLEYKPDSDSVYKISGIYPKFMLRYGENNEITVERRDNKSNGVY